MKARIFVGIAVVTLSLFNCQSSFANANSDDIEKKYGTDAKLLIDAIRVSAVVKGETMVVVNLTDQELSLINYDEIPGIENMPELIMNVPCNTGRVSGNGGPNLPTPNTMRKDGTLGFVTVIDKENVHHSKEYDSPMPFAIALDFRDKNGHPRGIFIHEGVQRRGYSASHGCIRLPKGIAKQVFDQVKKGTKVFVIGEAPNVTDEYMVWKNGKPTFKADSPNATDEDRTKFLELFKANKLTIDYRGPGNKPLIFKDESDGKIIYRPSPEARLRLETMPRGSGMRVDKFEEMFGKKLNVPVHEYQRIMRLSRGANN